MRASGTTPGVPDLVISAASEVLGGPLQARALGGDAYGVAGSGRQLVVKIGPGAQDEAAGLRALAAVPGAPPVPEVLCARPDALVTAWVEQGPRQGHAEEALGRALATLHEAPWPSWGGGSSWIGRCPVDPAPPEPDGAVSFYSTRLLDLASRCDLVGPVSAVVTRLEGLLPGGGPALVHGDLWWGNVLWGADGRGWLIDPSVHGGHPEEDLAMLGLFGPVPDRLLAAYQELRPLQAGWRERVGLWQLYPLLVHSVLFGAAYRARAEAVARRYR